MTQIKTTRKPYQLLNQVYLTYGMTHKLPDVIMNQIQEEEKPRRVIDDPSIQKKALFKKASIQIEKKGGV